MRNNYIGGTVYYTGEHSCLCLDCVYIHTHTHTHIVYVSVAQLVLYSNSKVILIIMGSLPGQTHTGKNMDLHCAATDFVQNKCLAAKFYKNL